MKPLRVSHSKLENQQVGKITQSEVVQRGSWLNGEEVKVRPLQGKKAPQHAPECSPTEVGK